MICDARFAAFGEVRLRGAHMLGDLDFSGANLVNPDGRALSAGRLAVAPRRVTVLRCAGPSKAHGSPTICGSQRSGVGSASRTDHGDVCAVGWRWVACASYAHLGPGMAAWAGCMAGDLGAFLSRAFGVRP